MKIPPAFFLFISVSATAVAQDAVPAERNFRLHHYSAELYFNPWVKSLKGKVAYEISLLRNSADSIVFYSPGIKVDKVSADLPVFSTETVFRQSGDNLIIFLREIITKFKIGDDRFKIAISYSAHAPKELHTTGWDDTTGRMRRQVWAHRPFGWIPFTDQMTTQDIRITFDKNYKVVTNGERLKSTPSGDSAITWHFRLDKPHPFYSVCFVAGDYEYKSMKTDRGLPLELWFYPDMAGRFDITYSLQKQMFDLLEDETGYKYPYSLYRNIPVADYLYGAMETTTSTVFADFMLVDARACFGRNYINTNAHELAHQWFGNCINDKTVDDLWLTESFATYYAKIFERKYLGEEAYEYQRDQEMQKALKVAESNSHAVGSGKGGLERWYQKGSLVMDMMRDVLGDDAFRAAIRDYMNANAFGEAESNDLLKSIYKTSGYALDWFFNDWIYRGGEPEYRVSWKECTTDDKVLTTLIDIEQVQKTASPEDLFRMPVNIGIYYQDGDYQNKKIRVEKQFNQVEIQNREGKHIDFIVFDEGRRILKKMKFERPFGQLSSQLQHARHMADRLEALRAMRSLSAWQKRELLAQCFEKEGFHLIRVEIISQLAGDSFSYSLLRKAIHDADTRVRNSVTEYIKTVPSGLIRDYEVLLSDSSYFIVEAALVNLANTALFRHDTVRVKQYLDVTKGETGWRGRNIRISWLGIAALVYPGEKKYISELIDYTGPSFDFETRLNALNQLKKLNYLDGQVARNLVRASVYWNYKLADPAKEIIGWYSQQDTCRRMIESVRDEP